MERKREFMAPEVWTTILTKYVVPFMYRNIMNEGRPTLIPHKDGESLLNKRFADMLQEASDLAGPGLNIDIYSHGLMLPVWKKRGHDFFTFLKSLPNRVRYLMSYHPYNHDGSVNDYTETNAYMKEVLQDPPDNVETIMVAHISKQANREAINAWREYWAPERDRRVMKRWGQKQSVLTVHANVNINPWTGRIDDPHVNPLGGCYPANFEHLFFGVTGNIVPCCLDLEEEVVFGNVMKDNPDEMFKTVEAFYLEQQRINAEKTGLKHELCRNCFGMGERKDKVKLQQLGGVA